VFATTQLTQVKKRIVCVWIRTTVPRHYSTIIGCVMRTCAP